MILRKANPFIRLRLTSPRHGAVAHITCKIKKALAREEKRQRERGEVGVEEEGEYPLFFYLLTNVYENGC